jgi:glutamine amidotransferase-like uncharacterized protein
VHYYWSVGRLRLLFWLVPFFAMACTMSERTPTDILLFNGRGTSPNDVAALESILRERHSSYSTANSERLGAMSEAELKAYRLVIIPGGNFEEIGNALTADTTARLRTAVSSGLSYLGICAGAFFAGASPYNGLNLTSGVRFPFYALEDQGIRKAKVMITTADAPPLEVYWEDGPHLTGWGEVVARYANDTAAVVQGSFGKGWVVLTGVHPEAPESWRRDLAFTTPVAPSHAYAARLIDAALHRTLLPRH